MRERIKGGLASGRRPGEFDARQLRRGTRVELEHVVRRGRKPTKRDRAIAREIAMDHLVEDPRYYTMLASAEERMSKRRNKYEFKWWHGALGLIGLSMVLGTARAVAANRTPAPSTSSGSYRNYIIELQRGVVAGWSWRALDQNGDEIGEGQEVFRPMAWSAAQDYIDWFLEAGEP